MQLKVIEWEEQDKENNNDRLNTVRSWSSSNSNTAEFHLCGCSHRPVKSRQILACSLAYTVWEYELLNVCHKKIYMNLLLYKNQFIYSTKSSREMFNFDRQTDDD